MNKLKSKKGITLIALIITIVILLVLAGAAINLSLGENGIITKTQTAVDKYENAVEEENQVIQDMYSKMFVATSGEFTGNITELKKLMLDVAYPVGSIYITTTDTDPAITLGGKWKSFGEGKTLIGAGTNEGYTFEVGEEQESVGATTNPKGEYIHRLTTSELPSNMGKISSVMTWGSAPLHTGIVSGRN